jgi:hypothetical protein
MKKDVILSPEELVAKLGDPNKHYHHKVIRSLSDHWGHWNSILSTSNWWVYREGMRFVHNQYLPVLPYDQEFHEKFYPLWLNTLFHTSIDDPTMIAFTPNPSDGLRDRQVRSKMGKFLVKYRGMHHNYNDVQISDFANRFNTQQKPPKLLFTSDPKEIARVYRHGPHSCMSDGFAKLNGHPCEPYGKDPIGLAYIQLDDGRIVARALVRHDTKEFVRPYGNEFAIQALLQEAGYTFSIDKGLGGLELNWMFSNAEQTRLLSPYLDPPTTHVDIDIENKRIWLEIPGEPQRRGTKRFVSQSTSGFIGIGNRWATGLDEAILVRRRNVEPIVCDHCEELTDRDDITVIHSSDGELEICSECLMNSDEFTEAMLPDGDYEWMLNSDTVWIEAINESVPDNDMNQICEAYGLTYIEAPYHSYFRARDCVYSEEAERDYLRKDCIYIQRESDYGDWLHVSHTKFGPTGDATFIIAATGEFFAMEKEYVDELQETSEALEGRIGTFNEFFAFISRVCEWPLENDWEPVRLGNAIEAGAFETNGAYRPEGNSADALFDYIREYWQVARDAKVAEAARLEAASELGSGFHSETNSVRPARNQAVHRRRR